MIGFVAPIEGAESLPWQAADQFRVLKDDVSPQHHGLAATNDFLVQLEEEAEIDFAFAETTADSSALSAAEVPGFVATDIKELAGEIGEQFVVETAQEFHGSRMLRSDREWPT